MIRRTLAVAAVAAVAVGLTGCTSGESTAPASVPVTDPSGSTLAPASTAPTTDDGPDFGDVATVPEGGEGESTGPLGSTELRVETDAGTVQIGAGSVPERLAADFPLPPDLDVQLASETATDLGFSGDSALPFAELVELFETGLPEAGYVVESTNVRAGDFAVIAFSSGDGVGEVVVTRSSTPGAHTVIVAFGDGDQVEN